jgi:hypothetical protein
MPSLCSPIEDSQRTNSVIFVVLFDSQAFVAFLLAAIDHTRSETASSGFHSFVPTELSEEP